MCPLLVPNAARIGGRELKLERRARQRWAIVACSILAAAFGLTVGILDVLH